MNAMSDSGYATLQEEVFNLAELTRRTEAEEFCALGKERHAAGDVEDAAAYFAMSLELYPTAEAYIGLGVTLAARGQWADAIAECEQAIALEPDLGNPYNDIAVYNAELGRPREALEWLDRALAARRYDCPHYSHYHRGRLLEQMGRFTESRDAYQTALNCEPDWEPAQIGLRRALGWLN